MNLGAQVVQYLLSGLMLGSIYALTALGFVTIYSVTGILNFAQGEFVMLGAMLAASLYQAGLSLPAATLLAVLGTAAITALLERLAIRPVLEKPPVNAIILTLGLSIILRGIAMWVWGTDPLPMPSFSPGSPLLLAGGTMERQGLWILAVTLAAVAVLFIFLYQTYLGKAFQACWINRRGARIVGIWPERICSIAFIISSSLAALAGVIFTPLTTASYDMGLMLGLKGFVAAALGGLASPLGAVLGGMLLGISEALAAGLVSSAYKDALAFLLLVVILLKAPHGLGQWLGEFRNHRRTTHGQKMASRS